METKKSFTAISLIVSAAMLAACKPVDETPSQPIYYIEASERFYIAEDIEEGAAETSDTTDVPETVTKQETETVTEAETGPTEEETEAESESEPVFETVTETETTETTTETTVEETSETVTETTAETTTEIVTEATAEVAPMLYESDSSAEDGLVKVMGRTYCKDGVRILSNTCSGVEFAFKGTSADITLTSNCKTSKARVGIYVNGQQVIDTMLNNAEETFHVFDSEESANCIISVIKLSEAAFSYAGVKNIHVVSEYGIIPTPERKRKIEFIGDSITCGYGVDAANQNEPFSTATENGMRTYAAIVAKHFKADLSIISRGGIGVYSSYTESSTPNQNTLMPRVYSKTDQVNSSEEWDFSRWQPDIIVVNLGTNDNTWTKGVEERVDKFGAAYYDFIVQIREANPNAYIICSLGVMGSKLLPEIKEQVALYSANTGDKSITTFEYDYRNGTVDGFGAGFHPSAKTHQKMADKLIPFITEKTGWE